MLTDGSNATDGSLQLNLRLRTDSEVGSAESEGAAENGFSAEPMHPLFLVVPGSNHVDSHQYLDIPTYVTYPNDFWLLPDQLIVFRTLKVPSFSVVAPWEEVEIHTSWGL